MDTKHSIFNLIILDESGSMQSIKQVIINGFNEVVQTIKNASQKFPEQQHYVTFVTFNGNGIRVMIDNQPVEELSQIDESKYNPDAMTPLYDAMGISISKQREYTQKSTEYNVLVTILTDGEENASKEYNGQSIKALVEELKQKKWTFTYIGANHDVDKFARSLSIQNSMTFQANEKETKVMFEKQRSSMDRFMTKVSAKQAMAEDDFFKEDDDTPKA